MSPDQGILDLLKEELPHLKQEYSVKRLALFGSASNGTLTNESDVDILVEFDKPLGLKFMDLCEYLEEKLGRKPRRVSAARVN